MSMNSIGLFKGLMSKMDYLTAQQKVYSQNIANADTPGYKAKQMKEMDFSKVVAASNRRNIVMISPERTNSHHMSLNSVDGAPRSERNRDMYEVSPTLNSVVIEEQMVKASQNSSDFQMMSTLYRRNLAMVRMAMGAGGNR